MNFTGNKALHQLNRFINSEKRYQFNITAYEISILYILCRYLDMPDKTCRLKQITFAKESGMSLKEFKRRCIKLVNQKLIFRYINGKLYHYELGEFITGIEN